MIIASHQPDLLPYSGFFYKLAKADLFDLKIFDQFVARGYQRRVKMRDRWLSVPIVGNPRLDRICEVRVKPEARDVLRNGIIGRYRGARYWKERSDAVLGLVDDASSDKIWQFNLDLILGVRRLLGLTTPLAIAVPTQGGGSGGLVSVLRRYQAYGVPLSYLSGTGARAYMGDCAEFHSAGIDVEFSRHKAVTGDSILSVIFDYADPLEIVLQEEGPALREQEGLI